MKEETYKPNFNIGQLVLAQDGDTFKILGCIASRIKTDKKWVYTVNWDDNQHGDEPYTEDDIYRFWHLLQEELNK